MSPGCFWRGNLRNTSNITRFIAQEARPYMLSASGLMRQADFPAGTPHLDLILANSSDFLANGGSYIAGPDGQWVIEPVVDEEKLIIANLEHQCVRGERQNFDPTGHYARPDVTQLVVNRKPQTVLTITKQGQAD